VVERTVGGDKTYHYLGFKATCVLMGRRHDAYANNGLSERHSWGILGNSIELETNRYVSGPWIDAVEMAVGSERGEELKALIKL